MKRSENRHTTKQHKVFNNIKYKCKLIKFEKQKRRGISFLVIITLLGAMLTSESFAFAENINDSETESVSDNIVNIENDDINNMGADEIDWDQYFVYGENNTEIIEYTGPFYKVVIPAKATSIAENSFDKKKRIVQSIKFEKDSKCTSIGNGVFKDCTLLSEIVLPESLESIGDEAFRNTALRKAVIPDSVKYIGSYAYSDNEGLTEAKLGTGINEIDIYAFSNCSKLKKIDFMCTNLTSPCQGIFEGCILNDIIIGEKVEYIADGLFESASFAHNSKIVLPETIISIGKRAFANAKNLSISISGKNLIEIKESAFEGSDIEEIQFPSSLATIGKAAFKDCVNIKEVSSAHETVSLGEEAFKGCINLSKAYLSDKVLRIGKDCFTDCSKDLVIYTYNESYAQRWAKKNNINIILAYKIIYRLRKGVNNLNNPIMYIPGDDKAFLEPSRKGYEFAGWFKDSANKEAISSTLNCKGTIKVFAAWEPISYSVKYVLNGDSVNNKANEKRTSRTVKNAYAIKKAKRKGYIFKGWYTNPEFEGVPLKKIGREYADDIILYAKWEEYKYNILFDANGGVVTKSASDQGMLNPLENIKYSESVSLPGENVMERRMWQGYVYTGWNTLPEGNKKNNKGVHFDLGQKVSKLKTKNNSKIVLYAEWTPVEYNVIYVLDGGINNPGNPSKHTVDKSVLLKSPEKPGFTFAGWYLDSDFNIKVRKISRRQPYEITLYAKWI